MQTSRRVFLSFFLFLIVLLFGFFSLRLLKATVTTTPADFIRTHLALGATECPTVTHKIRFWTDLTLARLTYDAAFDVFSGTEGVPVVNVSDAIVLNTAMIQVMLDCQDVPYSIAQCTDGIDNDADGTTDGVGIRILERIATLKVLDTVGSLINGSFVRSEVGKIPWMTVMPLMNNASVSSKIQFFTPGSFQNEQMYDSENGVKAVQIFEGLTSTVQADLCDPADIEEFHLVGVRSPLHGILHVRVATGKCTGIVVFSQGDLNSAYARKDILIETLPGSRIARVAVFNNSGRATPSVYGGIPQDRILQITPALEEACYNPRAGYLCYSASVFSHPNYSILADGVRSFFGVPSSQAPASTYDCNFDSRCGSGTCYPDKENGTGIIGVVIGSGDPTLRPDYWNVIQPEHWMKTSEFTRADGTIFASFGSWPIIKQHLRMLGAECTGTESITRVPVGHFVRIETGNEPVVRDMLLPDNIQYLSDLVWDEERNVLYGIAATAQQVVTHLPGEYRLVTIDPESMSLVRSVALPQLGGFIDFQPHRSGTSLDSDWFNWMPITVSEGPTSTGNFVKSRQLFLDVEDNVLVLAGFARRGIHTQPGAVPADRSVLRIDLDSMAIAEQKIVGFGYETLKDIEYDPVTDSLIVSISTMALDNPPTYRGSKLAIVNTRTGVIRTSAQFTSVSEQILDLVKMMSNGHLLVEKGTRWSVVDIGDFHEIVGFEKVGSLSFFDETNAFLSEPDAANGRTLYRLNFLTGERTAIMGPAADVPGIIQKDAVANAYYISENRRQIAVPLRGMQWFYDWKSILPCNP